MAGPCESVSVVLEVLEVPVVPRLYFWALQADFGGEAGRAGGAHLGLQWHPGHPRSTAVNWGGYNVSGAELGGTPSGLPSATANVNTRDFAWSPGRRYRLSIERADRDAVRSSMAGSGMVAWRGSVQDFDSGESTVVRELLVPGGRIVGATMWSEVFARCDDPPSSVRWSSPTAHRENGAVPIARVHVNYQAHDDGGCVNTSSEADPLGLVQRTNASRRTTQGTVLGVPSGAPSGSSRDWPDGEPTPR